MTGKARPAPLAGSNPQRPTTGFIIIEDMLTELSKTGRCGTLERWVGDAEKRLQEARDQATGDRARSQADRVRRAYAAAQELVRGIHEGKIKRP